MENESAYHGIDKDIAHELDEGVYHKLEKNISHELDEGIFRELDEGDNELDGTQKNEKCRANRRLCRSKHLLWRRIH
jgi:hypothetical protein